MLLIMSKENPTTACDLTRSAASTVNKHNKSSTPKNGVTGLLLSHPENTSRKLPENFLTRTVENAMRGLEQEERPRKAGRTDRQLTVPNHASQLLKAAASQVNNEVKPVTMETQEGTNSEISKTVFSQPHIPAPSYITNAMTKPSNQLHHLPVAQNGSCCTTVSFTSKPTMSTGFASYNPVGPFSTNTHRLAVPSAVSAPSLNCSPKTTLESEKQILVPFLWKRTCENGKVMYYR